MKLKYHTLIALGFVAVGAILIGASILAPRQRSEPAPERSPEPHAAVAIPAAAPKPISVSSTAAPASPPPVGVEGPRPPTEPVAGLVVAMGHFSSWSRTVLRGEEALTAAAIEEGERLARLRRVALRELIKIDPARAIEMAIPMADRQLMPESVAQYLEERVSGFGSFEVDVATDENRTLQKVTRWWLRDGKRYQAFVYGRRASSISMAKLWLHGIAVDGVLAVNDAPARILEAGEPIPEGAAARLCGISGRRADSDNTPTYAEVNGRTESFCGPAHVAALNNTLWADSDGGGGSGGGTVNPAWSTGHKTLLYIRVKYSDDPTDPISLADATTLMAQANSFYLEASFGLTDIAGTVTPLLTMLHPKSYYLGLDSAGFSELLADARAVALSNGYDTANYSLDAVRTVPAIIGPNGGPHTGGRANVAMKGIYLGTSDPSVTFHEMGHNYGLSHASSWNPSTPDPVGPGSNLEYGDNYDVMGSGNGTTHFNGYHKRRLNWLPSTWAQPVTASGTYRIYPVDANPHAVDRAYGLCIRKDSSRDYFAESRYLIPVTPSNPWIGSGAILHWTPWSGSGGKTQRLFAGPLEGSQDTLTLGRTLSDQAAGLHLTPVATGGTGPDKWLDVFVQFGNSPGNRAPTLTLAASQTSVGTGVPVTFTATATDPDGDTLAYHWYTADHLSLANSVLFPNVNQITTSWGGAVERVVRCVVSDMKGGTISAYKVITVGNAVAKHIAGRVTSGGVPVEGVVVRVSTSPNSPVGYTDADGYYTITPLISSSYSVTAKKSGYTLTPAGGWANPVALPSSVDNIDFTAAPSLPAVSLAVNSSQVTEGCHTPAVFTVTRTGSTANPLAVFLGYFGTAIKSADFTLAPDPFLAAATPYSVTIPAGASSATVTLLAVDDYPAQSAEGPETVTLTLFADANYLSSHPPEATVTIVNSTLPSSVGISPAQTLVCESSGVTDYTMTLTRSGSTAGSLTVDLNAGGTATFGTHYEIRVNNAAVPNPQFSVSIPSGATAASFVVRVLDNAQLDGDRTVTCGLPCSSAYRVGNNNNTATITIRDDETPPLVQLPHLPPDLVEGPSLSEAYITVTRPNGCLAQSLPVTFTTSGSAIRGVDYEIRVGGNVVSAQDFPVTISAPSNYAIVVVRSLNDSLLDYDKVAVVSIVPAAGYTVGANSSVSVALRDDEVSTINGLTLSGGGTPLNESPPGNSDTLYVSRVNSPPALAYPVTVDLRVLPGSTATLNLDYQLLVNGSPVSSTDFSVTIPIGSPYTSVPLQVISDVFYESAETIQIVQLASSNYRLSTSQPTALQSINNDDAGTPQVGLTTTTTVIREAGTASFTLQRSGGSSAALPVNLAATGDALAGTDYQVLVGGQPVTVSGGQFTITFAADQATVLMTVPALDDTTLEYREQVVFSVLAGSYAVAKGSTRILDILDNEPGIVAGYDHSLCLRPDYGWGVWSWGNNANGQLGDGTTVNRLSFIIIPGLGNIVALAASSHSLAVRNDGTVWAWGLNANGQLGDGSVLTRYSPVPITGIGDVVDIAAGDNHTVALKRDGTVWSWGLNASGQLGDGTTLNRPTPVPVTGLGAIVAVAAGAAHSAALASSGLVYTWGANQAGQLGDGTFVSHSSPAVIPNLTSARSLSARRDQTQMVRSDGTGWGWGNNTYGQLGDGTTITRPAPVPMSGLTGVRSLASGYWHTVILKEDGSVWACGWNYYGQIGDGSVVSRPTAVQSGGLVLPTTLPRSVSAGFAHSLASRNNVGSLFSWGYNDSGQLGDGTTSGRLLPGYVND